MSQRRDLLMLNKLRAPVGNMWIFIRIEIRILHVVQSADPQSADPHFNRSPNCSPSSIDTRFSVKHSFSVYSREYRNK